MFKSYFITPLLLLSLAGTCKKTTTSLGANLNFLHNKIYGGLQFSVLKEQKLFKTTPNWTFQFNYGIFGIKKTTENLSYDAHPPFYQTKEHYIKNVGWSFHFAKEFKIANYTFFGLGMGHAHIRDKGYLIWEAPYTNELIKKDIDIDVSTVYFLTNLGFHYDLNKRWHINAILNLYFHTPVTPVSKDDEQYILEGSLPTLGAEQDISISINYKF